MSFQPMLRKNWTMTISPSLISKTSSSVGKLSGQIAERQRDAQTSESKIVVTDFTLSRAPAQAVVKAGFTGKLIIITVYVL